MFTHHHRLSCDLTARLPRRSSADGLSASLAPLKASVGKFLGGFAFCASGDCAYPGDAVVVECYCVEGECLIAAVFAFVGADRTWADFHAGNLIHHAPRFKCVVRFLCQADHASMCWFCSVPDSPTGLIDALWRYRDRADVSVAPRVRPLRARLDRAGGLCGGGEGAVLATVLIALIWHLAT